MTETLDFHAMLQVSVLVLALVSGIGQVVILRSSSSRAGPQLIVLGLAVLSSALNVMAMGLADLRSILHIVVLGLAVLSGSLQVVVLGLMTRRKRVRNHVLTTRDSESV